MSQCLSVCPSVRLCGTKLSRAVYLHLSRVESNQRAIRALRKRSENTQRAIREQYEHLNQSHTVGALNTASCLVTGAPLRLPLETVVAINFN